MSKLGRSLRDVVKKLAYSTSVDQLKKDGVKKVNVMGMDQIAFLIQQAVKNSLRYKLLALDREEVASATKAEFLRLLKSNEDLERQQDELRVLKDRAEAQVDDLRREITDQRKLLAEKLAVAANEQRRRHAGADLGLKDQLEDLVAGLTHTGKSGEIPGRVYGLVMSLVEKERNEATQAREEVRNREVHNLQRRIEKLTESLSQTEHRLSQVSAIRHIDEGISSVYREVQGLDEADGEYATKNVLMASIFEANVRLQGK